MGEPTQRYVGSTGTRARLRTRSRAMTRRACQIARSCSVQSSGMGAEAIPSARRVSPSSSALRYSAFRSAWLMLTMAAWMKLLVMTATGKPGEASPRSLGSWTAEPGIPSRRSARWVWSPLISMPFNERTTTGETNRRLSHLVGIAAGDRRDPLELHLEGRLIPHAMSTRIFIASATASLRPRTTRRREPERNDVRPTRAHRAGSRKRRRTLGATASTGGGTPER